MNKVFPDNNFCLATKTESENLDMALNPELLRQLEHIEDLLRDMDETIANTQSLSLTLRTGLRGTISAIVSSLQPIKAQSSSLLDETGKIDSGGVGGRPDLELDFMTLRPATKEVTFEGKTVRLPRSEFMVLYSLASAPGIEIELGTSHSLLTRLSTIRRQIPATKQRIESLGKGRYVLHASFKNK